MAKDRKDPTSDGRHLLVVGLPVGIVLGVLIVGAVLQSGPVPETDEARMRSDEPPLPPPATYEQRHPADSALDENLLEVEPEVEPVAEPEPVRTEPRRERAPVPAGDNLSALARRVRDDMERLGSSGDIWTSQIGVYCDDQSVADLVRRYGGNSELYVLPALLDDRACFRVCWGHFPNRNRAEQTRSLPDAFRGDKPLPRTISSVVE